MAVMDKELVQHEYISGNDYSIADMAIWPWIYGYENFYKTPLDERKFPHLAEWYQHVGQRAQIKAALAAYE